MDKYKNRLFATKGAIVDKYASIDARCKIFSYCTPHPFSTIQG